MSEDASVDAAVEQVTQEVKDVKLENGSAPGALNGTANKAEGAISLKVLYRNILPNKSVPKSGFSSLVLNIWYLFI